MADSNKIDLRLDPGLREQIEAIAVERFEAKIHHISKKPELTTTINKLIKLGIKYLEEQYQDNTVIQNPDSLVTPEQLEAVIAALRSELMTEIETVKELEPVN